MAEPATDSAGLAAVRAWCGWHIAPSLAQTVKVEGQGNRVLLLPSLHVTEVTEVRNEAGDALGATTYKWRENGIVRGCWTCEDLYSFDIVHGYDETPAELAAIIEALDSEGVGSRTVSAQSAGPFSQTFGAGSDLESQPLSVRAIIARYALPSRP